MANLTLKTSKVYEVIVVGDGATKELKFPKNSAITGATKIRRLWQQTQRDTFWPQAGTAQNIPASVVVSGVILRDSTDTVLMRLTGDLIDPTGQNFPELDLTGVDLEKSSIVTKTTYPATNGIPFYFQID